MLLGVCFFPLFSRGGLLLGITIYYYYPAPSGMKQALSVLYPPKYTYPIDDFLLFEDLATYLPCSFFPSLFFHMTLTVHLPVMSYPFLHITCLYRIQFRVLPNDASDTINSVTASPSSKTESPA